MIGRTFGTLAAAASLLLVMAAMAGAAQTTVVQAIKAQDKSISRNPTIKSIKRFKVKTKAEAQKFIPEIQQAKVLLDQAATAVSQATASTSKQKSGQKDWVAGVRKQATGLGNIETALNDIVKGDPMAANAKLGAAVRIVGDGSLIQQKGDKLLGLPLGE